MGQLVRDLLHYQIGRHQIIGTSSENQSVDHPATGQPGNRVARRLACLLSSVSVVAGQVGLRGAGATLDDSSRSWRKWTRHRGSIAAWTVWTNWARSRRPTAGRATGRASSATCQFPGFMVAGSVDPRLQICRVLRYRSSYSCATDVRCGPLVHSLARPLRQLAGKMLGCQDRAADHMLARGHLGRRQEVIHRLSCRDRAERLISLRGPRRGVGGSGERGCPITMVWRSW